MAIFDRFLRKSIKIKTRGEEMRRAFFNPEIVKHYYEMGDEIDRKIWDEQASKHGKKPFNSPYWWAYLYFLGLEASNKLPEHVKKKLKLVGEKAIKKAEKEAKDGV